MDGPEYLILNHILWLIRIQGRTGTGVLQYMGVKGLEKGLAHETNPYLEAQKKESRPKKITDEETSHVLDAWGVD
jgi:hypothetical protein